jgi:membrane protein YqaA with SNARE-associated domain
VIAASATALLIGVVSAFLPLLPVEPYVVGAAAINRETALPVALAAGIGQTIGKTLIFLAARGSLRSKRLHDWVERRRAAQQAKQEASQDPPRRFDRLVRWLKAPTALLKRESVAVPVILLSAVVGIPPLLLTTFYVAAANTRLAVFVGSCLVGRCARFMVLAYLPGLASDLM